jgi:hypothetical protein
MKHANDKLSHQSMDQVMKFTATSWFQLLDVEDIFRLNFDLEKSPVDINILDVSIKGVSYDAIKVLRDNTAEMHDLVDKLFIEKKIMWQDFRRGTIDTCIYGLKDLGADLNAYKANLLSTGKSEHLLLAEIIQVWAAESDKAVEAFKMAKYNVEFMLPEEHIIPILGKFRANTLKIAGEFIGFLESGSAIRNYAEQLYDCGLSELMRYLRVNYQELKGLSYSITLVPREPER